MSDFTQELRHSGSKALVPARDQKFASRVLGAMRARRRAKEAVFAGAAAAGVVTCALVIDRTWTISDVLQSILSTPQMSIGVAGVALVVGAVLTLVLRD